MTNNKPIIAIDIDEVLLPHFQGLITWYNQQFGTKLTLAHNHPTNPAPWGTDSIPEAIQRVQGYFKSPEFLAEKPFEEAIDAIEKLSKDNDCVVITARDDIIEDVTRQWLEKHFTGYFKEAHFTSHYSLEGNRRSKAKVAKAAGATYLIDDSLDHVLEAASAGITAILFGDYAWNQAAELPPGVIRCKNWAAVLEYFNERG